MEMRLVRPLMQATAPMAMTTTADTDSQVLQMLHRLQYQ
jgi:hypothetical protein